MSLCIYRKPKNTKRNWLEWNSLKYLVFTEIDNELNMRQTHKRTQFIYNIECTVVRLSRLNINWQWTRPRRFIDSNRCGSIRFYLIAFHYIDLYLVEPFSFIQTKTHRENLIGIDVAPFPHSTAHRFRCKFIEILNYPISCLLHI